MEEREKRIRKLENELKSEREKSVDDLTKTFERIAPREGTSRQITLSEKLERLVEHFEREKNERIRKMLDRISSEEKTRVAKLIEKHSQEMLLMIAEKIMASEVCHVRYGLKFIVFSNMKYLLQKHRSKY